MVLLSVSMQQKFALNMCSSGQNHGGSVFSHEEHKKVGSWHSALCSFCEKSWCHTWPQLKHDSACNFRSAYIQLRQTGLICHLLTSQATQLLSVLSFCPALTTATAYLLAVHSFSLTDCRNFRLQLCMTCLQGQKTWPCPTHSSVTTLAANQAMNTVQNFHALHQCNPRH